MAWALQFDGVNDYAEDSVWIPSDLDNWTVKIRVRRDSGTANGIVFTSSDFNDGIYINASNGGVGVFVASANLSAANSFSLGSFHDVEVVCLSGTIELFVDGVSYGSRSRGSNLTFLRGGVRFASRFNDSAYINQSVEYAELTDTNTPSNSRRYDAAASSRGVGTPELDDIIGGNVATGVNMPTDGSAWIDLGGGGVSLAVDSISTLQSITSPNITQNHIFSIDNIANSQSVSQSNISTSVQFSADEITSSTQVSQPTITQASVLSVDSITSAHSISEVALVVAGVLGVEDITSLQSITSPSLIQNNVIDVDSLINSHSVSEANIDAELNLVVSDISTEHAISSPGFTQHNIILVDPLTNNQFTGVVRLNGDDQDIGTIILGFKDDGISVKYTVVKFTVQFKGL